MALRFNSNAVSFDPDGERLEPVEQLVATDLVVRASEELRWALEQVQIGASGLSTLLKSVTRSTQLLLEARTPAEIVSQSIEIVAPASVVPAPSETPAEPVVPAALSATGADAPWGVAAGGALLSGLGLAVLLARRGRRGMPGRG